MRVTVSAHFDMFNMETCTLWPLCETLGSDSAVVENLVFREVMLAVA